MTVRGAFPSARLLAHSLGFGGRQRVLECRGRKISGALSGQRSVEELWRQFFSDPFQWCDHRTDKVKDSFPDFKHRKTGVGLWIDSKSSPLWVKGELADLIPGSVPRSPFYWNPTLSGYVKSELWHEALELFSKMLTEGVIPDSFTFVMVCNACASLAALKEGRHIHTLVIERGFESDLFVGSTLVDMYSKCGSIEDAWRVFSRMPTRNVVSWTAMLDGCVKFEQGQKALKLYEQMQAEGVKPNSVTFLVLLNACASSGALEEGRHVHAQIIQSGYECDVRVNNCLVAMYSKCGSIDDAQRVFNGMPMHDLVSWTAMISGCVKCERGQEALELFQEMQEEGVKPDSIAFGIICNACASLAALEEGRLVHEHAIQSGCVSDLFVGNSLVNMYSKCSSMDDAWRVFDSMHTRDVVSWTVMLAGCVKSEQGQRALELFRQMQAEGVKPNAFTFVIVCNACASVAALGAGRHTHAQAIQSGFEADLFLANSLVDMYAKCGSLSDAWRVFNGMPMYSVVSCNAMLGGLAMHGHGYEAVQLFEEISHGGLEMDAVTFICLLSACSHAGLVDEGLHYFESMNSVYGVSPTVEHYACVIDLLGRAGCLVEAEQTFWKVSSELNLKGDIIAWTSLLGACRNHGNLGMGERIAQQFLELYPGHSSGYLLLSNIYGAAGHWDKRNQVQQMRKERGVRKVPGSTWIEVDNQVHSFVADDQAHPQIVHIHAELQRLSELMPEAGYKPDTKYVLHDLEEEEKVLRLSHHSEKLAIAFGLISTTLGTPLLIYKNLRVCCDCHTATKFIANIVSGKLLYEM